MSQTFQFTFVNFSKALVVILEPWCEELALPARSTIEIKIVHDKIYPFETCLSENYFTIYHWQEGRTQILIDNVDVTPDFLRGPM